MSVVALVKNTIAPSRPAQPEAKMARADASSFASIRLAQEQLLRVSADPHVSLSNESEIEWRECRILMSSLCLRAGLLGEGRPLVDDHGLCALSGRRRRGWPDVGGGSPLRALVDVVLLVEEVVL